MSNKLTKFIEAEIRKERVDEGYYDGRFKTKSVPNKRLQFLEECDENYDDYILDVREKEIKKSFHRI